MRDSSEQLHSGQNSRAKFKQRAAGGAVLLIVLAIFLPFIFNHSHLGTTAVSDDQTAVQQQQPAPATDNANPIVQSVDQTNNQSGETSQAAAPATADTAAAPAASTTQTTQQEPTSDQLMQSNQPGLTPSQTESTAQPLSSSQSDANAPQTQVEPTQPVAQQNPSATALPSVSQAEHQAQQSVAAPQQPVVAKVKMPVHHVLPSPGKTVAKSAVPYGRWVVQVGSFAQAEYAQQLATKLRAHGLNAYTRRGPNQLTHVYVGPLASQQQAQKIQQQMRSEFQMSSLLIEKRA